MTWQVLAQLACLVAVGALALVAILGVLRDSEP